MRPVLANRESYEETKCQLEELRTYLNARRPSIKDNNSTKNLKFSPVACDICNTIWVLFMKLIFRIRKSTGRSFTPGLQQVRILSIPPGLI